MVISYGLNFHELEQVNDVLQPAYILINILLLIFVSIFSFAYIILWIFYKVKINKINNNNVKNIFVKSPFDKLVYAFIIIFILFFSLSIVYVSLLKKANPFYVYYYYDGKQEIYWYKSWGSLDGINWVDMSNSGIDIKNSDFDMYALYSNSFESLDTVETMYWVIPFLCWAPLMATSIMLIVLNYHQFEDIKVLKNELDFGKFKKDEKEIIDLFGCELYKEYTSYSKKIICSILISFLTILFMSVLIYFSFNSVSSNRRHYRPLYLGVCFYFPLFILWSEKTGILVSLEKLKNFKTTNEWINKIKENNKYLLEIKKIGYWSRRWIKKGYFNMLCGFRKIYISLL